VSTFACEICGKSPAVEEGLWTLCSDCSELYVTFLNFVKQHDVDVKDLEPLKETLRLQAKEIGLVR
jgi:hypothetical protein